MAVSVRKPVLYAFGVVLCAGIIGGIWLWLVKKKLKI